MKKTTLNDKSLNLQNLAKQLREIAEKIEKHENTLRNVNIEQDIQAGEPVYQEITLGMIATEENLLKTEELYLIENEET